MDLWAATGCNQDEISKTLLDSFDLVVGDIYNYQQESGVTNAEPPGYIVS